MTPKIIKLKELVMLNNSNFKNKPEPVEVMALFGYEMTPCQPLTFRQRGGKEVEITELLRAHIKFTGDIAYHIFDVLVGQKRYQLEFNSVDLSWNLTSAK